jgi:hypothetical protein
MRLRVSAILTLLTLTVLGAGAQQAPPTPLPPGAQLDTPIFRATVDAIELDAFVVDAQGNPVTDLTVKISRSWRKAGPRKSPRSRRSPSLSTQPSARSRRPTVPDVRTNEQPEGRIYLIAVDEIPGRLVPRLRLHLRQFRRAELRGTRQRGDCLRRSRALHRRAGFHERSRGAPPLHRQIERRDSVAATSKRRRYG